MAQSPTIGELTKALCAAQAEFDNAVKDSKNPFFNSTYADLTSVFDACRKQLAKHGLAVAQPLRECDDGVIVETVLMHTSGEWIAGDLKLKPLKNDPQGIGSCITYGRRFSLESILGIAREEADDDGNAASQPEKKSAESKAPPRSAPAEKGGGATTPPATSDDEEYDIEAGKDHARELLKMLQGLMPGWAAEGNNSLCQEFTKGGKFKGFQEVTALHKDWQVKKLVKALETRIEEINAADENDVV